MFRELIYQISAFTFTVTKNLCGAFELNEQPGWRMELNTTATAVPLPISCPTKETYSGNYQREYCTVYPVLAYGQVSCLLSVTAVVSIIYQPLPTITNP